MTAKPATSTGGLRPPRAAHIQELGVSFVEDRHVELAQARGSASMSRDSRATTVVSPAAQVLHVVGVGAAEPQPDSWTALSASLNEPSIR
ncbi:MAG: hypothetical protein WKF73_02020 [Nocardioidaceae bacterium]